MDSGKALFLFASGSAFRPPCPCQRLRRRSAPRRKRSMRPSLQDCRKPMVVAVAISREGCGAPALVHAPPRATKPCEKPLRTHPFSRHSPQDPARFARKSASNFHSQPAGCPAPRRAAAPVKRKDSGQDSPTCFTWNITGTIFRREKRETLSTNAKNAPLRDYPRALASRRRACSTGSV